MSSGTPESPDRDPKDWQSSYGSPGGQDPNDGQPSYGGGYSMPGQAAPYDQQYGAPGGYPPQDQPYAAPGQGQQYAAPGQAPYGQQYDPQQYGAAPQQYDQYGQPYAAPGAYDQGYGTPGQAPYGQPYAAAPPPGYGQPGYGQPQGPYQQNPYGYPPRPAGEGPRTHAIVALVISIVLALSCYVSLGGIAGAILSGIALGKVDTEPQRARSLLKWVWVSIGINVALVIAGIAAIIVVGIASGN